MTEDSSTSIKIFLSILLQNSKKQEETKNLLARDSELKIILTLADVPIELRIFCRITEASVTLESAAEKGIL
tara:strand:- start:1387 stop:1602 length:216 start_codon:yes stop_codon:yes gene_type:complete